MNEPMSNVKYADKLLANSTSIGRNALLIGAIAFGGGVLAALIFTYGVASTRRFDSHAKLSASVATSPTAVLEPMGQLIVTKVRITDVLEAEGVSPKVRGLWVVFGDANLVVDLDDAEFTNSDFDARKATLVLPKPRVDSPRVDHERTKTYDIQSNAWLPWQADRTDVLAENAMIHAQKLVEVAASQESYAREARDRCQVLIGELFKNADWQVTIHWRDEGSATQ